MSAGAVRQGRVFVEIGADAKNFFSAVGKVNNSIGSLGSTMSSVGVRMAAAGSALFAPIAAAGAALAANTKEVEQSQNAIKGIAEAIGQAVAPAFVGLAIMTTRAAEALSELIRDNPKAVRMIAALGMVLIGAGGSLKLFGSSVKLATDLAGFLVKPLSLVMSSVISLVKWFSVGAVSIVSGMSSLVSSSVKATIGLIKMSIAGIRAAASLAAVLVRAAASAAVALGRAAVAAATMTVSLVRMGVALAIANPYAAAFIGIVSAIGIVLAYISGPTNEAGEKAAQAGVKFGGFGKWVSGAFESIKGVIESTDIGKAISSAVGSGVTGAKKLFGELRDISSSTIDGVYNEIAAGDWAGAIEILWAGILAAFDTGKASIMGALDPWTASVQGVFVDAGVGMAIAWEQAWTAMATDPWGQIFLGAMDNVINAVMASWDWMIGSVQKGWARISGLWKDATAVDAEIKRIDDANANNASQRGNSRPGIEGRQGVDKDKLRKESESRVAAMAGSADEQKKKLEDRNKANIGERAASASDAKAKLDDLVKATKAPPDVVKAQGKMASEIVGTFSGLGAGQMAGGGDRLQQAQLRELEKLNQKAAAGNAAWAP